MQVNWPFLVQQNTPRFKVVGQSLEPQTGLSGAMTVVSAMGARWEAKIDVQVRGQEAALQFEAFLAGMEGYLGTTYVPVKHIRNPRDMDGRRVAQCGVAEMLDGEFMEHWGMVNSALEMAELGANAALRATEIEVVYTNTTGIRPGHFFQIGQSLCQAQLVWVDAGVHKVRFQPPLRAAALMGDQVILDTPALNMRLTNPDSIDFDQMSRVTQYFSLAFVEAV